jgi:hypothetical protein
MKKDQRQQHDVSLLSARRSHTQYYLVVSAIFSIPAPHDWLRQNAAYLAVTYLKEACLWLLSDFY